MFSVTAPAVNPMPIPSPVLGMVTGEVDAHQRRDVSGHHFLVYAEPATGQDNLSSQDKTAVRHRRGDRPVIFLLEGQIFLFRQPPRRPSCRALRR
ncbi:MAG: hypothetical protein VX638_06640 [Chloroflexota bacterium]|nr:hypothetical protein [Chloroflexota bacterium]